MILLASSSVRLCAPSRIVIASTRRRTFWSGRSSNQFEYQARRTYTRDPGLQWTSVISNPANSLPGPTDEIPSRAEQIQRLRQFGDRNADVYYDVLVVGGGATGAGCALDAASRGLSVAAVERGDFASETSSRSTKLIWAGIKYLGTAVARLLSSQLFLNPYETVHTFYTELKMVRSCHIERRYMTSKQQHLVRGASDILFSLPF
jgi:FAD dependent oxidoreductase